MSDIDQIPAELIHRKGLSGFGWYLVRISAGTLANITEVFLGFTQSFQAIVEIVSRADPFPSRFFPIHHLLITPSLDLVLVSIQKARLNHLPPPKKTDVKHYVVRPINLLILF
jgi:hypothetical protein